MLRELQEQIKLLEARLAGQTTVDSHGNVIEVTPDGQERVRFPFGCHGSLRGHEP